MDAFNPMLPSLYAQTLSVNIPIYGNKGMANTFAKHPHPQLSQRFMCIKFIPITPKTK